MRKNGKLVGLLLIAIVLTLVAVVSIWNGPKANNNNSSPEVSFIWQKPAVSFAELSNSGIVSQEIIVENTDFTRKTIRFKPGTTSETKSQIISDINGKIIENTDNNTVVVKISEESLSEAERELTQSDSVALFETDYAVGLLSIIDWGVARIGANEIWDQSRARGIRVGIIDTGIDRSHPDLANYAGALILSMKMLTLKMTMVMVRQ